MASTRLPNKPLADIAGVPMIVRVASQASRSQADTVVVAVDDERVARVVAAAGYDAALTAVDHASGSDRVMEVVHKRGWQTDDIVINVQGDEPLLPPALIDQLAKAMQDDPSVEIATLAEPISSAQDFLDPNVVKVVTDRNDVALYFSRAPIPFPRDDAQQQAVTDAVVQANNVRRHVGVYGFRVQALTRFITLTDSRLENIERLEQLRWLEAGGRISVLQCAEAVPGGVDTPDDLARVQRLVRQAER
jgi:3-deoxy-manno-octulosonate cytidylyltransferase (CMP-KDO synthetase)